MTAGTKIIHFIAPTFTNHREGVLVAIDGNVATVRWDNTGKTSAIDINMIEAA